MRYSIHLPSIKPALHRHIKCCNASLYDVIILCNLAFRSLLHILSSGLAASYVPHSRIFKSAEGPYISVECLLNFLECDSCCFSWKYWFVLFFFLSVKELLMSKARTQASCQRFLFLCSRCWHLAFYENKYILTFNLYFVKCWREFKYLKWWLWFKKRISLAILIRFSFSIPEL